MMSSWNKQVLKRLSEAELEAWVNQKWIQSDEWVTLSQPTILIKHKIHSVYVVKNG